VCNRCRGCHLQLRKFTRTLLDEIPQRWVVPYASAAHVQYGAREVRGLLCLCRAAALAFFNQRIILPNVLGKLHA
jgi:hypothetical protein